MCKKRKNHSQLTWKKIRENIYSCNLAIQTLISRIFWDCVGKTTAYQCWMVSELGLLNVNASSDISPIFKSRISNIVSRMHAILLVRFFILSLLDSMQQDCRLRSLKNATEFGFSSLVSNENKSIQKELHHFEITIQKFLHMFFKNRIFFWYEVEN